MEVMGQGKVGSKWRLWGKARWALNGGDGARQGGL